MPFAEQEQTRPGSVTGSGPIKDLDMPLKPPSTTAAAKPPLNRLCDAIRELVRAIRLGEDKERLLSLSQRIFKLCTNCKPNCVERTMQFTTGSKIRAKRTCSEIHFRWRMADGRERKGVHDRPRPAEPTEFEMELHRIRTATTLATYDAVVSKPSRSERGHSMLVPAVERLLTIADRLQPKLV